MHEAAIHSVFFAQISFFIGISLCVLLKPSYVLGKNQGGISNYATDRQTVLFYSLAFLLDAVFTLLTAYQLLHALHSYRLLVMALVGLAALVLIVLASSYIYKRNAFWHWLHFFWGIALVTYQSVLGILLLGYTRHYFVAYAAFAVLLAGDVIGILSLRNIVQRLFLGQVLSIAGFMVLLCGTVLVI